MLARSEGLARVRVRPRRGRRAALARWQGHVSAVSHTRPNHSALKLLFCDFSAARPRFVARLAHSDSPQSRGPCPRADPPSPRPARSASELARSRHRSPTCAVRLRTNPGTNILLFVTAVGPPAVLDSLKPLNNVIQLPLHVPCIVSNNYFVPGILLLVVGYTSKYIKKHVYVYAGPNTSIRTCSAIHHGWLCVPCEDADDKGSGLFRSLSF